MAARRWALEHSSELQRLGFHLCEMELATPTSTSWMEEGIKGLRVERHGYQGLAHAAAQEWKLDGRGCDRVADAAMEAYACPKETDSKEGVLGKLGMGGGRQRSLEWAKRKGEGGKGMVRWEPAAAGGGSHCAGS